MKLMKSWLLSLAQFSMLTMVVLGTSSIYSAAVTGAGAGVPAAADAMSPEQVAKTQFGKFIAGDPTFNLDDFRKALKEVRERSGDALGLADHRGRTLLQQLFPVTLSHASKYLPGSRFQAKSSCYQLRPELRNIVTRPHFNAVFQALLEDDAARSAYIFDGTTLMHILVCLNVSSVQRLALLRLVFDGQDRKTVKALLSTPDKQGFTPVMRAAMFRGCPPVTDDVNANTAVFEYLLSLNPDIADPAVPHHLTFEELVEGSPALSKALAVYREKLAIAAKVAAGVPQLPSDLIDVIAGNVA